MCSTFDSINNGVSGEFDVTVVDTTAPGTLLGLPTPPAALDARRRQEQSTAGLTSLPKMRSTARSRQCVSPLRD